MDATNSNTISPDHITLEKDLLFQIIAGEIQHETRMGICNLGRLKQASLGRHFYHLFGLIQGSPGLDNKELARELLPELRYICKELEESEKDKEDESEQ